MTHHESHKTLIAERGGQRLDLYLVDCLPDLTRSAVKRLIQQGSVLVDGQVVKAGYKLRHGETIALTLPKRPEMGEPQPLARAIALDILYEDDDILALNKAAGDVVHPAPGHENDTLVNALLAVRPEIRQADADPQRPGIVHRLDRDTTGLLLVAKHRAAQDTLLAQFRARTMNKLYLCLAHGRIEPDEGAIDAPIARHLRDRQRMAVVDGGRPARTEYVVLENTSGVSLVAVKLVTGRTHQIRVHFAAIGHPVVGDATYGGASKQPRARRQMLHAWRLSLSHPMTGAPLSLVAPPPDDMVGMAERLGLQWDAALVLAEQRQRP